MYAQGLGLFCRKRRGGLGPKELMTFTFAGVVWGYRAGTCGRGVGVRRAGTPLLSFRGEGGAFVL